MFVVCEVVLGNRLYFDKNVGIVFRANLKLDGTLTKEEMKSVSIKGHRLGIPIFQDAGYTTVRKHNNPIICCLRKNYECS